MHDRECKLDPPIRLREAAGQGDLITIFELILDHPHLDLNEQDPVSGRTALHEACYAKQFEIVEFLTSIGADKYRADNHGFFPVELIFNPYLYDPRQACPDSKKMDFLIDMENTSHQQIHPGSVCRIFFISRIEEMNSYIKKYPDLTRIGFIVLKPNVLRLMDKDDCHVFPIYYERYFQLETVVQLDSSIGQALLVPQSEAPQIKRTVIYSPFQRQAASFGCFEDAVDLLGKLMDMPAGIFVKFCRLHSTNDANLENITYFNPTKEEERYNWICAQKTISPELEAEFSNLEGRRDFFKQAEILKYQDIPFVSKIYKLYALHPVILLNIERFDTMRYFRVHFPQLFPKQIVKDLLKKGVKREPSVPDKEIENNLHKEDKRYDVAGPSFPNKVRDFALLRKQQDKFIFNSVHTLFSSQSSGPKGNNSDEPARLVAGFITGL